MSLRPDGIFTKVLCDTCGAEHHTTETSPTLAWYDAVLHHGWVPGGAFDPPQTGTHCPDCWTGGPIPHGAI